jgi:hypothetical protein
VVVAIEQELTLVVVAIEQELTLVVVAIEQEILFLGYRNMELH